MEEKEKEEVKKDTYSQIIITILLRESRDNVIEEFIQDTNRSTRHE